MKKWVLVDGRDPAESPDDFPTVELISETHLRGELLKFQCREPSIIALSSDGEALQIGLGGELAGIRWFKEPPFANGGEVLADRVYCDHRIDFLAEGDTISFWPENLMPAEIAIEVICHYYNTSHFPTWVCQKNWDNDAKRWVVVRARTPSPAFPSTITPQVSTPPFFCPRCTAVLRSWGDTEAFQICFNCQERVMRG